MQGFNFQLNNASDYASLPHRIDEEMLAHRVSKLREGDTSQVEPIVVTLMRPVVSFAASHSSSDDAIGEALLELVESVERAAEVLFDESILKYVLSCVAYRLGDTPLLYGPKPRTRRLHKQLDKHRPIAKETDFDEITAEPDNLLELEDTLASIIKTDREAAILELRSREMSCREIGKTLGLDSATVWRDLQILESRFQKANRD